VRKTILLATLAAGALALAGCANGSSGAGSSNAGGGSTSAGSSAPAQADVATASTSLGKVVVDGVTGQVGTAPGLNGVQQVTLAGHRLYTFSGDSKAGQVNGQSYMNLWWVLSPAGQLIKASAGAATSSSSSATPVY